MEVCEVCGAFLIVGDAQSRVDDHLQGKQHVGYAKIKSTLEDMKVCRVIFMTCYVQVFRRVSQQFLDTSRLLSFYNFETIFGMEVLGLGSFEISQHLIFYCIKLGFHLSNLSEMRK